MFAAVTPRYITKIQKILKQEKVNTSANKNTFQHVHNFSPPSAIQGRFITLKTKALLDKKREYFADMYDVTHSFCVDF